jgi:GT2 family glycosyltransferase
MTEEVVPEIFVSIVTFNSDRFIVQALEALLSSSSYTAGENLQVLVVDNASEDDTVSLISKRFPDQVTVVSSSVNLGFCGGHNLAAKRFVESTADYLLILNPDAALEKSALKNFLEAFRAEEAIGAVTPLLLRAEEDLTPCSPSVIDAAGMVLTPSLRHFDRGSGMELREEYLRPGDVFAGTGACLMLSRKCVEDVSFFGNRYERDLSKVYPELAETSGERVPLFDEAFFAFRDDAELGWRMQRLGWKVRYAPKVRCYHRRNVLPERRGVLPDKLNALGVKNRFLLQWNHFSIGPYFSAFIPGFVLRNLLVIVAVLLRERSSLSALRDALLLRKRAKERSELLARRARVSDDQVARWLTTMIEPCEGRDEV